jgi:hypothetical protein
MSCYPIVSVNLKVNLVVWQLCEPETAASVNLEVNLVVRQLCEPEASVLKWCEHVLVLKLRMQVTSYESSCVNTCDVSHLYSHVVRRLAAPPSSSPNSNQSTWMPKIV